MMMGLTVSWTWDVVMEIYRTRKWLLCLAALILFPIDFGLGRAHADFRMMSHSESIEKLHRLDAEFQALLCQWETLKSCHQQHGEKVGHLKTMYYLSYLLPTIKTTFSLSYRPGDDLFSSSIEMTGLNLHKRSIFFSLMVTWDLYHLLQPNMKNDVDALILPDQSRLALTSNQLDVLFGQLNDLMGQYQDLCAAQGREKTLLQLERMMVLIRIYLLEIKPKCSLHFIGFDGM